MTEQVLDRPGICSRQEPAASGASASRWITAICLIVAASAWARLGPEYLRMLRPGPQYSPDFYQEWAAARNLRIGLPVYSPHVQTMPIHLGRPQAEHETDIEYNAHPPVSVLLALPFSSLDLPDAVLAWNLLMIAALAGSLAIAAANLPELKATFLPVALFLPFLQPVYGNFLNGQPTFLLLLLITAAWSLDRSGRPGAAGIMVGAAAAVKLFPAYLVVYLAARGRWRGVLAAAVSFAAINLATAAVLGWTAYRDYIVTVLPSLEKFRSYGFNLSIGGYWYKLFDPVGEHGRIVPLWNAPALARWLTLVSNLFITAAVVVVTRRARSRDSADLAFAMTTTAMLLVSPITWANSLPLLLMPIAVASRAAATARWSAIPLIPIVLVFSLPQKTIEEAILGGPIPRIASPAFILGVGSLCFYMLLALLVTLTTITARARV